MLIDKRQQNNNKCMLHLFVLPLGILVPFIVYYGTKALRARTRVHTSMQQILAAHPHY